MSALLRQLKAFLGGLAVAAPNVFLAYLFFGTWLHPMARGEHFVRHLMILWALEFLVLHSAAFTGIAIVDPSFTRKQRLMFVLGATLFYLVCVGGFWLVFSESWPVWGFALLSVNRLSSALVGRQPSENRKALLIMGWVSSFVLYVVLVLLAAVVPMPELGVTGEIVPQLGLSGEGIWPGAPQKFLAAASLYYTSVAVLAVLIPVWIVRASES